jgi:hypothetical protein
MNKKIVIAVLVIGGSGVISAWNHNKPVTPVIMGSYIFLLMLSIADMFGGELSKLSGALAMLAMTYVLLEQDSFLWDILKQQTTTGNGAPQKSAPGKGKVP